VTTANEGKDNQTIKRLSKRKSRTAERTDAPARTRVVFLLIWLAGCVSVERRAADVTGSSDGICGDAIAPRLAASSFPPGEAPDDCVLQWARRGKPFSLGSYAPPADDLVNVGEGHELRSAAAAAFRRLQAEAAVAGHTIVAVSGYRSHEQQASTHATWVRRRLEKSRGAISRKDAEKLVDHFSARPGHSEHQLGTTVDVSVPGEMPFNHDDGPSSFSTSCAGKWVRDNAHRFGFTLSYPYGLEAVTCFQPEPWHFRYVGPTLATRLAEQGLALEEFFRQEFPDVEVPAGLHCPPTQESLRYDVAGLAACDFATPSR
jgi:hypothetical protein